LVSDFIDAIFDFFHLVGEGLFLHFIGDNPASELGDLLQGMQLFYRLIEVVSDAV
jgi:hypothetical protein